MTKSVREKIVDTIIKHTQNMNIKSFSYENEVIDFMSLRKTKIDFKKNIKISNKYIALLCQDYEMNDLKDFMNHNNDFNIITNTNKYVTFQTTSHANIAFLKRLVYIYMHRDIKFEFSNAVCDLISTNINECIDILINQDWRDVNNDFISGLMSHFLISSRVFTFKEVCRKRDLLAFEHRNKLYENTTRYFNHPIMFVVENGILKTVELYSSTQDMRHLNKFTSNDEKFNKWLKNKARKVN